MFNDLTKIDPAVRFARFQQVLRANPELAQKTAQLLDLPISVTPRVFGARGIESEQLHMVLEHEIRHICINDPQMWFSPDLMDPGPGTDRDRMPLKATLIPKHSEALAAVINEWKSA
jgi:hypothetical protein